MYKNEKGSATNLMVALIIFLAVVVLGIFGYSISKESKQKKQVEQEILSLKTQADNIQKENMALTDRIAYLGSKDYQEVQAKDKLNLQSPGESVVIIAPKNSEGDEVGQALKTETVPNSDNTSNPVRWWNYFFNSQNS